MNNCERLPRRLLALLGVRLAMTLLFVFARSVSDEAISEEGGNGGIATPSPFAVPSLHSGLRLTAMTFLSVIARSVSDEAISEERGNGGIATLRSQ